MSRIDKSIGTKVRLVVAELAKEENEELLLMGMVLLSGKIKCFIVIQKYDCTIIRTY